MVRPLSQIPTCLWRWQWPLCRRSCLEATCSTIIYLCLHWEMEHVASKAAPREGRNRLGLRRPAFCSTSHERTNAAALAQLADPREGSNHLDLRNPALRWTSQGLRKWRQLCSWQHPGRGVIICICVAPHSAGPPRSSRNWRHLAHSAAGGEVGDRR